VDVRTGGGVSDTAAPIGRLPLQLVREGLFPRILGAIALSLLAAAILVALAGQNPLIAFRAMIEGAFGSPYAIGTVLNRTSPYLLAGAGLALCFRAGIINMGSDGQIAAGGMGATATVLAWPGPPSALTAVAALLAAALAGAAWSGIATAIHLGRRVHEVLVTLLLNFVALLLVQLLLAGPLGQVGAGFLQSPPIPRAAWLWRMPHFFFHGGILVGVGRAAAVAATVENALRLRRARGGSLARGCCLCGLLGRRHHLGGDADGRCLGRDWRRG
jgi:simple sugar transport system permease protein